MNWDQIGEWTRRGVYRAVSRYNAKTGFNVELQVADVDDCVQEAAVLLVGALADYEGEPEEDDLRKSAYKAASKSTWKRLRELADNLDIRLDPETWESLSEESIRFSPRHTDLSGLEAAIAALPSEESRNVATLLALANYTQEQMAEFLGCSRSAVENQIRKLHERLGCSIVWRSIRSGARLAEQLPGPRTVDHVPAVPHLNPQPLIQWIDRLIARRLRTRYRPLSDIGTHTSYRYLPNPWLDTEPEPREYVAPLPRPFSQWIPVSSRSGGCVHWTYHVYAGFRDTGERRQSGTTASRQAPRRRRRFRFVRDEEKIQIQRNRDVRRGHGILN